MGALQYGLITEDVANVYPQLVIRMRRGKGRIGEAKLEEANQRGPHWADLLKAWGDILTRQRHMKEALAKFADALKYAPNWVALEQARETVKRQKS
jgi:hypothetical protein